MTQEEFNKKYKDFLEEGHYGLAVNEEAKQRAKNYMSLKGALEPKQTAVEWFFNEIKHILPNDFLVKYEQAQQMEKEQIIDACNQTDVIGLDHEQPGQQYYKQTYKQQKTMTPKEKAAELVNKFVQYTPAEEGIEYPFAKQCAVIAVDEILLLCPFETYRETLSPYDGAELSTKYWQEVKQEIQNL